MEETMSADLVENLVAFCENRKRVYALLSRCYEKEMDAVFAAELAQAACVESETPAVEDDFASMQAALDGCNEHALEQLAVVFNRVFFGMGPRTAQKAFPYESVYTSEGGLMMQEAYSAVLATYRSVGFAKNPDFTEPEDHLAVELSFMALLCDRAVDALRAGDEEEGEMSLRSQQAFLNQHLLNWISPFAKDMRASAVEGFYVQLASFTESYLQADDEALAEVLG